MCISERMLKWRHADIIARMHKLGQIIVHECMDQCKNAWRRMYICVRLHAMDLCKNAQVPQSLVSLDRYSWSQTTNAQQLISLLNTTPKYFLYQSNIIEQVPIRFFCFPDFSILIKRWKQALCDRNHCTNTSVIDQLGPILPDAGQKCRAGNFHHRTPYSSCLQR